MDLQIAPSKKSILSPKSQKPPAGLSLRSSQQTNNHKLAFKHVGTEIYPVVNPQNTKKAALSYFTEDVNVYYKRRVKHFDQSASSHILPGAQFNANTNNSSEVCGQTKIIKIKNPIKPMRPISGADRKLFRTTFDPRALSNLKSFDIQDYNMMWADNSSQYNRGMGIGKTSHIDIVPCQRKNATTFKLV